VRSFRQQLASPEVRSATPEHLPKPLHQQSFATDAWSSKPNPSLSPTQPLPATRTWQGLSGPKMFRETFSAPFSSHRPATARFDFVMPQIAKNFCDERHEATLSN
jgi:hypothetical protein